MKKILFPILFLLVSTEPCLAVVSVIGALTRENTVNPGETYEAVILVTNKGENPHEVRVYKTDYLFFADGRNVYGEPGSVARSNAPWLSLSPSRFTIPPNQTVSVHCKVQVPADAELRGSYWSMVMVEPMAEANPEATEREKGKIKIGLQTIIRYGIQFVTDIGRDTGTRKIRFADKTLVSEEGKRIFKLDIENIGERWLSPLVWIELYNQAGQSVRHLESGKLRIYPGCSVRHVFDFTNIPKGRYKALVVADNGDEHAFGARYDIVIE